MKTINVSNCSECPFCVVEMDYDAIGYDTLRYCNAREPLAGAWIIDSYDSYELEEEPTTMPEWCPLKEQEEIKVIWNGSINL